MQSRLKLLLDEKYHQFNRKGFIDDDPIQIPHRFENKQDIEIAGFFAAILAWGQRKTIINKCSELMNLMGNQPYQYMLHHSDSDLKALQNFKHRTFNSTDLLHCVAFFKWFYSNHNSLEEAFLIEPNDETTNGGLVNFHNLFFSLEFSPTRTRKHIATPARKSACKRLNMYLRWMVRKDERGVDFGIWDTIKTSQLICPLDVHVERVARKLGLLYRKQSDWLAAVELTNNLKQFDANDPVKYDFALFGMGVENEEF